MTGFEIFLLVYVSVMLALLGLLVGVWALWRVTR